MDKRPASRICFANVTCNSSANSWCVLSMVPSDSKLGQAQKEKKKKNKLHSSWLNRWYNKWNRYTGNRTSTWRCVLSKHHHQPSYPTPNWLQQTTLHDVGSCWVSKDKLWTSYTKNFPAKRNEVHQGNMWLQILLTIASEYKSPVGNSSLALHSTTQDVMCYSFASFFSFFFQVWNSKRGDRRTHHLRTWPTYSDICSHDHPDTGLVPHEATALLPLSSTAATRFRYADSSMFWHTSRRPQRDQMILIWPNSLKSTQYLSENVCEMALHCGYGP